MRSMLVVVVVGLVSACGPAQVPFDAGTPFIGGGGGSTAGGGEGGGGGTTTDAGATDGGDPDAGELDSGVLDAGVPDAGELDSGVPDAGVIDAGMIDAGAIDAGLIDAGLIDAGLIDAGLIDAGLIDIAASDVLVLPARDLPADGRTVAVIDVTAITVDGRVSSGREVVVSWPAGPATVMATTNVTGHARLELTSAQPASGPLTITIDGAQLTAQPQLSFITRGTASFRIEGTVDGLTTGLATSPLIVGCPNGDITIAPGATTFTCPGLHVDGEWYQLVVRSVSGMRCAPTTAGSGTMPAAHVAAVIQCWPLGFKKIVGISSDDIPGLGTHPSTLALAADDSLWEWGMLAFAPNTARDDGTPPRFRGAGFVSMSRAEFAAFGVKHDGTLWAWGADGSHLGTGDTMTRLAPVQIGTGFESVVATPDGVWGIKTDHTLWSWGFSGQLTPTQFTSGIARIASNGETHLAVKTDGTLIAWGYNFFGQLGDGTTSSRTFAAAVNLGTGYAEAGVGARHVLALTTAGELYGWGRNDQGQVGDGTTTDRLVPTLIGTGFSELSAGAYHSAAAKTDGTTWVWGSNTQGQLASALTTTFRSIPTPVGATLGLRHVVALRYATFGLDATDRLWGWGAQDELGLGSSLPVQSLAGPFIDVALGDREIAAIGRNGELWVGPQAQLLELKPMGTGFVQVRVGYEHGLALKSDGSVWAWGKNANGQLGVAGGARDVPVQVDTGYVAIGTGSGSSFGIKQDGSLWAWGANNWGQHGDGTTLSRSVPTQVGTSFRAVSGAALHTHGLKFDRSLWSWGENDQGQLGDGTTAARLSPVQILTEVRSVSAGLRSGVAVRTDGTALRWGDLADESTTSFTTTPQQFGSQVGAAAVGSVLLRIGDDGSVWRRGPTGSIATEGFGFSGVASRSRFGTAALRGDGSVTFWRRWSSSARVQETPTLLH